MNLLKILLIGVFGIVSVMVITAMITIIAPYVAALVVLLTIGWLVIRFSPNEDDQQDK